MAVWRQVALAGFLCISALALAGFGPALTGENEAPTPPAGVQVAQDTTAPAEEPAATEPTEEPAAEEEAAAEEEEVTEDEGPAEFTEAFLSDPAHIESGKVVWET